MHRAARYARYLHGQKSTEDVDVNAFAERIEKTLQLAVEEADRMSLSVVDGPMQGHSNIRLERLRRFTTTTRSAVHPTRATHTVRH